MSVVSMFDFDEIGVCFTIKVFEKKVEKQPMENSDMMIVWYNDALELRE